MKGGWVHKNMNNRYLDSKINIPAETTEKKQEKWRMRDIPEMTSLRVTRDCVHADTGFFWQKGATEVVKL